MTKDDLADLLNRREYGAEISAGEAELARAAGLVVMFGASDDLVELRGAVRGEVSAYNGAKFCLDAEGVIPESRDDDWDDDEMDVSGGNVREGLLCRGAGSIAPTPEEADVFRACRLAFVPPAQRHGPAEIASAEVLFRG